ncbi:serine/threonine dehydratase [Rickettsia endosymbiont of Cardiosporidium cionae]|uniref:serine/threonine dehydratase n=1 Tax=Rickettsia endosymbiont of Cardiosporidium cionae TaxID=2777155 RepID=UPI001893D2C2|nr:serine/threonine dehydratase [Rickettsia endosymbiont of Cardiosporidium cionae]KAF8818993.1 threonine/serine dehydratase [Rickettsia endosymbiont of Cardiosporidium cionae]
MYYTLQDPSTILEAHFRIKNYVNNTPIIDSKALNKLCENNLYFKVDSVQKTGAFKIRGVLNYLLYFKEKYTKFPKKIVTYSTGNHALALSYAADLFDINVRIYLPQNISSLKKYIISCYNVELIEVTTRNEAENRAIYDIKDDFLFLHPSDNEQIISGAGTMCYEAIHSLNQEYNIEKIDAIFAPCGGGGLLSGTYLAKELLSKNTLLIGAEPKMANDAYISLQQNKIYEFQESPSTVADGLKALRIAEYNFEYLKKLNDFYLVTEEMIYFWSEKLIKHLRITCEPSAAVAMAATYNWIVKNGYKNKNIIILISGGNTDPSFSYKLFT